MPAVSVTSPSSLSAFVVHAATKLVASSTAKAPRTRAFPGRCMRFTNPRHFLIANLNGLILFDVENLTDTELDCLFWVDYTVYRFPNYHLTTQNQRRPSEYFHAFHPH